MSEESVRRSVLVCGGRDYRNRDHLFSVMDYLIARRPINAIICGGARGADMLAFEWAMSRQIICHVYPARWDTEGKGAGPLRNIRMLNVMSPGVDGVVAFPGGRGTEHMIQTATGRGFGVLRIT